ncbi:MAG: IS256 family transposase [Candidatus Edwardsbacteria bacterium]
MLATTIAELEEELKCSGVKELGTETLEEKWLRVKEDFWGDLKEETVRAVKKLIETSMEVEVKDLIGSSHWKHNSERLTYRNGYYQRGLLTSFGYLTAINVPRIRDGGVKFKVLKRYQRRTQDIDRLILEMFLNGVSTRRVEEVLTPLFGPNSVSAGLVSKVTKVLDKQVRRFHQRKLLDKYEYLILDGIFLNAKSPVEKKRRCVLVVYGIWCDGKKVRQELIDFQLAAKGESENAWFGFLNNLYYRGLEGKKLRLITIDGNKGLRNAIDLIYPNALPQRCWAHKLRNVANKLPRKLQSVCISQARDIYNAESYNKAVVAYKNWKKTWGVVVPEAVECLEKDLEELLNFYQCPEEMRVKLRTTNIIERTFREVRRRTRPMSCFQNRGSVERIIFAIFYRLNRKWGNEDLEYLQDSLHQITQFC